MLSPDLVSLIGTQLAEQPKYGWAAYIHRTENELPLTFDARTAWQIPILQDNAPQQVFMKCSQVGVTVIAIVNMMILLYNGLPGIYVLPTGVAMYDFVKGRIDPMLSGVPFYRRHYATEKEDASGARMKTIFKRRVKFAGSNVRNSFFEMPAGWYIVDEWDRCDRANLDYLEDRISRADVKIRFKIGNPTFNKTGIHAEYLASDQEQWLVKCPSCNRRQPLTWFENVVRQVGRRRYVLRDRTMQMQLNELANKQGPDVAVQVLATECEQTATDARIFCSNPACARPIDRHSPGEWVPAFSDRPVHGRHINKIFGDPTAGAIVNVLKKQILSQHDPTLRQRWFNNDLGLPYEEQGSRVTDQLLADAAADYEFPHQLPFQILQHDFTQSVMGVDVGTTMHVHISGVYVHEYKIHRVKLFIGQVEDPEQLWDLITRYNVTAGVIDAMPETRMSRNFAKARPGFWMAYYSKQDQKIDHVRDKKKKTISLNRTEALDASLADYDAGLVTLPMNWRSLDGGKFAEQMKAPTRAFSDEHGRIEWSKCEDHHRHADTYEYWAARLPGATTWGGMKGSM
jgi:hypothetical protein